VSWRNNTGVAREIDEDTGKMRPVRYGLGNDTAALNEAFKMGDLVGIYHHWLIIPNTDTGFPVGTFCMWECKKPHWRFTGTPREQAQWTAIQFVRKHYGRAGFVTHPDQAVAIMLGNGFGAYNGS